MGSEGAETVPASLPLTDISSNHLALLTWVLERQGQDPRELLGRVGVEPSTVNSPTDRVPLVTVLRVMEQIQSVADDPSACLHLYGHMKLAHLNVLGFALSCSTNLLELFERARRFSAYLSSAFLIQIEDMGEHYRISARWSPTIYEDQLKQEPNLNMLLECAGYSAIGMLQEAYGAPVPIKQLFLPGQPHEKVVGAFAAAVNCPVHTGSDFLAGLIDKRTARTQLPGANPELARINDQQLTEHLATIERSDIVHRCERLILRGLPDGRFALKDIASQLGMSERVVQAKLRKHDQSFSDVLNRVRKTLAVQYIEENKKHISEIAYALGFESPSNFSRAFRSWTGYSPRRYKEVQKYMSRL